MRQDALSAELRRWPLRHTETADQVAELCHHLLDGRSALRGWVGTPEAEVLPQVLMQRPSDRNGRKNDTSLWSTAAGMRMETEMRMEHHTHLEVFFSIQSAPILVTAHSMFGNQPTVRLKGPV